MGLYIPNGNPYSIYNDKHSIFEDGKKGKDKPNPYIPGSDNWMLMKRGK